MSIQARKTPLDVAFAAAQAHNDTRKGKSVCLGFATGSVTLASGTAAVTSQGIPANAIVTLMLTAPGGTLGAAWKVTGVGTSGGFTVTSVSSTGTTNTSDTSTLTWTAEWPLFHADQTPATNASDPFNPSASTLAVTATNATDLPSSITLANQIRQVLNQHMADSVSHVSADGTNPVSTAVAVDLTSVEALLNACKTAFNAHLTQSGVHVFNDGINTVSTSNATHLASSEALANALKTAINAHMGAAPTGESVAMVAP
jgi:hypothetical protein